MRVAEGIVMKKLFTHKEQKADDSSMPAWECEALTAVAEREGFVWQWNHEGTRIDLVRCGNCRKVLKVESVEKITMQMIAHRKQKHNDLPIGMIL